MNDLPYKKIKSKKIYEVVIDELLHMIVSGQLKPGDRLDSVQQLAENFQVGRSAIREALSALRAMGLVEMRQGEGTFIKEYNPQALSQAVFATTMLMDEKDIQDLLEVRKILEAGSAASAARKWEESDLDEMAKALADMKAASESATENKRGNTDLGEQADLNFHMAIAKASHNALLEHLMSGVADLMADTMRETRRLWLYSKEATLERLYQEHKQIFEAIKSRDAQAAQERMLDHLERVEEVLMTYFHKREGLSNRSAT